MADWQFQAEQQGDERLLDDVLESLQAQLANVGAHLHIDGAARARYQRLIHDLAQELRQQAQAGNITWTQAADIQLNAASHERLVERTRILSVGEDDDLVLQRGDIAQAGAALVVWPEIFAIRVEDYRANGDLDLLASALCDNRRRLVELREEQLVEIRFAKPRSCKDETAARYQ